MLRIVDELHHVSVAVGRFEQVCLRSAAHFSNQTAASVGMIAGAKIGYS